MAIAVFGLGYVGCVSAACFASLGRKVFGVDRDEHKVATVNAGGAPFYEPGLDQLVERAVGDGHLIATTSVETALAEADVAIVCVGTPSDRNGSVHLAQLRHVVEEIGSHTRTRMKRLVVAIRSTVPPGTCERVVAPALSGSPCVGIVSNPEFLREGCAISDFLSPSLIVVGGSSNEAVGAVASLYAGLGVEPCLVSLRTAEMIKYACNAYHAVKVAFANEVGAMSESMGVDGREVMETLCRDRKLNVSAAYLKPGFAFGGSCLPKDLRAIVHRGRQMDLSMPLLESVLPSNEAHLRRGISAVYDRPERRIGVLGLAFKENTDDVRESPVVAMLEYLIGRGRDVRVFDAHLTLDSIYGTNRQFVLDAIPHIRRLMAQSLDELLAWSECVVLTQRPDASVAGKLATSGKAIVDLAQPGGQQLPVTASAAA